LYCFRPAIDKHFFHIFIWYAGPEAEKKWRNNGEKLHNTPKPYLFDTVEDICPVLPLVLHVLSSYCGQAHRSTHKFTRPQGASESEHIGLCLSLVFIDIHWYSLIFTGTYKKLFESWGIHTFIIIICHLYVKWREIAREI
jgi:hypothetical protein